jgi:hypothetical protein
MLPDFKMLRLLLIVMARSRVTAKLWRKAALPELSDRPKIPMKRLGAGIFSAVVMLWIVVVSAQRVDAAIISSIPSISDELVAQTGPINIALLGIPFQVSDQVFFDGTDYDYFYSVTYLAPAGAPARKITPIISEHPLHRARDEFQLPNTVPILMKDDPFLTTGGVASIASALGLGNMVWDWLSQNKTTGVFMQPGALQTFSFFDKHSPGKVNWGLIDGSVPGVRNSNVLAGLPQLDAPAPEPDTLLLLGSGLAVLAGLAWRRQRK